MRVSASALLTLALCSCTAHLFSGVPMPDHSRPVVRIETRGGVEYGAATSEGIVFLGYTAKAGPCRVHYFLGSTPVVEDGLIEPLGGVLARVDVDLKQQCAPLLGRDPSEQDELVALVHAGMSVQELPVRLAHGAQVAGDLIEWPGRTLPAGTGIFVRADDRWSFVGLVSGEAEVERAGVKQRYCTFAGADRLREALATPRHWPLQQSVKHRPDDISLVKRK